jgi:thymidylate synthase (FAD)
VIQEKISAEYIEHMGSDLSVVNAARQSFAKLKDKFDDKDASLIDFLATGMRTKEWDEFLTKIGNLGQDYIEWMGISPEGNDAKKKLKDALLAYKRKAQHWAPFGHPHISIRMRLPIFLARQFVKHQVGGTWSEESRRYMSDEPSFYFEPVLHGRPDDIKQGADGEHPESEVLSAEMKQHSQHAVTFYKYLINSGVAPEEARQVLTQNTMTGVTWTGSLLFWARVVTQRVDPHAQKAAQHLGRQINDIMAPLFPVSWHALVGNMPE